MRDWSAIIEALEAVPVIELRGRLARMVPLGDLVKNSPPDFLFTSGKPNRYNPAGIECVYFSEDEATARLEYARQWANLRAGKQPEARGEFDAEKFVTLTKSAPRPINHVRLCLQRQNRFHTAVEASKKR